MAQVGRKKKTTALKPVHDSLAKLADRRVNEGHVADPDKPLTERQRRFVMNYVDYQMTQTAAAATAGFSEPTAAGALLVRMPHVAKAVRIRRAEYAAASQITRRCVIDGMLEAVDLAKSRGEALPMIAGWKEIAKLCGHYPDERKTVHHTLDTTNLSHRLGSMTDAELLALAQDPERGGEVLDGLISEVSTEPQGSDHTEAG